MEPDAGLIRDVAGWGGKAVYESDRTFRTNDDMMVIDTGLLIYLAWQARQ